MNVLSDIVEKLRAQLFRSVVSNNLVYNTCWEDPRLDREMLQLDDQSEVVMLTSAGCNALDYLIDNPSRLFCIDKNPVQNALLQLKLALIKNGNPSLLWDFFGCGQKEGAEMIYNQNLRKHLSSRAQTYWDNHINYFSPYSSESSFYFRGTSGKFALMIRNRIRRKGLYGDIKHLFNAKTLEEQAYYFNEVEPLLWNGFQRWLLSRNAILSMIGVPSTQRRLIEQEYPDGILRYIRKSLREVFIETPIQDNYFWRVYLTGSYTPNCCPNYLKEEYFDVLQSRANRIETHTSTLSRFLRQNPGTYSHFVLLDHQDWMIGQSPELLAGEWEHILGNAVPGTRILFRSVAPEADFIPSFAREKLSFDRSLADNLHYKDRVGTYESTHLAVVQ
jgi:S-adenosylmethionine-diacylglycerol 3-amino-3-carboxypropyl transferase